MEESRKGKGGRGEDECVTDFGVDEDSIGGQVRVHKAGILVQKFQGLANLQQSLLNFELIDLELAPPPHAVGILGDIATRATTATRPFLAIFLL